MKKLLLLSLCGMVFTNTVFAQFSEFRNEEMPSNFTLNSENNVLSISGRLSAFYENRDLKTGQLNMRHNSFFMKDADLDVLGKTKRKFVYELQVSILDLANAANSGNNVNSTTFQSNVAAPDAPGIKAAYVSYEGDEIPFHVKLGFDKLPYSQGSINDAYGTPMWSHANLVGGDFYSRRDLGLTLSKTMWKKRINVYLGAYTGMGENVFEYGSDASGKLEYVGRIDVSYPSRYKYDVIDEEGSPIPVFRIGINGRYTDKTQPSGHDIMTDVPDAPGAYGVKFVNGKKTVYGGDFAIKYKGLSFLFEADVVHMQPVAGDALFLGTTSAFNGGVVNAGGWMSSINYNWERIRSVFSVNYEEINGNDLADGSESWLYLGYAYKVNGFNSVFKIEFYKPVKEDLASNPLKYNSQLRLGYQIVF